MFHTTSHNGAGLRRRSLLILGGSAAALTLTGLATAQGVEAGRTRYIVTDRRHAASLAFARTQADAGAVVVDVTGGLTRLWRDVLQPHWQSGAPGAVAGLTTREVWACLAEQARSQGLVSTVTAAAVTSPAVARPSDSLVSWVIG